MYVAHTTDQTEAALEIARSYAADVSVEAPDSIVIQGDRVSARVETDSLAVTRLTLVPATRWEPAEWDEVDEGSYDTLTEAIEQAMSLLDI
jgi:hypothetical protein